MTINKFDELLSIFDRRLPIFEKIAGEIERRKPPIGLSLSALTVLTAPGNTVFAAALEKYLNSKDYPTQLINLDDFHNTKEIRYAGENQAENYFHHSFDIQTIIHKLLIPLREKGEYSITLKLLDLQSDKYKLPGNILLIVIPSFFLKAFSFSVKNWRRISTIKSFWRFRWKKARNAPN